MARKRSWGLLKENARIHKNTMNYNSEKNKEKRLKLKYGVEINN